MTMKLWCMMELAIVMKMVNRNTPHVNPMMRRLPL